MILVVSGSIWDLIHWTLRFLDCYHGAGSRPPQVVETGWRAKGATAASPEQFRYLSLQVPAYICIYIYIHIYTFMYA